MPNPWFQFKQFTIWHNRCAMKVGTDGVLLGAWVNQPNAERILDIGTGTGLISLMIAQKTFAAIDAIDIDEDAVIQAQENFSICTWTDRLNACHYSLQDYSNFSNIKYDVIVSNPPFFVNSLKAATEKRSLARHADTLSSSDLLKGVDHFLSDKGCFYIVLPYVEAQVFLVDSALLHLYCNKKMNCRTAPNKSVSRVLMEFSRIRGKCQESELIIHDENNNYSTQYKELTKDYYLKF